MKKEARWGLADLQSGRLMGARIPGCSHTLSYRVLLQACQVVDGPLEKLDETFLPLYSATVVLSKAN